MLRPWRAVRRYYSLGLAMPEPKVTCRFRARMASLGMPSTPFVTGPGFQRLLELAPAFRSEIDHRTC